MPFPPIPSQIRCPKCNHPFMVEVHAVVDVGLEPELKDRFLRGELNRALCPECGTGGLLNTALVYHDPAHELLVAYVPSELQMSAEDQERTIGSLVNAVMNETPSEQRKAYFFSPKTVLTYDSLYETVLEAEGFSKELLEKQRTWLNLINDLVAAMDDEEAFNRLADENNDKMDYEFYLLLADLIDTRADGGSEGTTEGAVDSLRELRERLLSRPMAAAPGAPPEAKTAEELIDLLLVELGSPQWDHTVEDYLPQLDYAFFQALTARLEAAEAAGKESAATLGQLRQALLDALDRHTRRMREAEDEASLLIMEIMEADDMDAAVSEHEAQLDDVFFLVLGRLHQTAVSRNNTARADRLAQLLEKARDARESKLPPLLRLISRLLRSDYPEGSQRWLDEEPELVTDELLRLFDRYVADVSANVGEESRQRLENIRAQVAERVPGAAD
ncbi:MAG: CpXC domain-containing protein [Anaerolineae bacterium]|jgi:hypothetical protein|nr:hypothetical protein [Chloroflexota bacterium]